jgi:hypothetical protein
MTNFLEMPYAYLLIYKRNERSIISKCLWQVPNTTDHICVRSNPREKYLRAHYS